MELRQGILFFISAAVFFIDIVLSLFQTSDAAHCGHTIPPEITITRIHHCSIPILCSLMTEPVAYVIFTDTGLCKSIGS
jgi:hypothetical protein